MTLFADKLEHSADFPYQNFDIKNFRSEFNSVLSRALPEHEGLKLKYLCGPKANADDTKKLLVMNNHAEPVAVVLVASEVEPRLVQQGMERASAIKNQLTTDLGRVILEPKATGWLHGRSYTILPYCKPLGTGRVITRLHNLTLRPLVIDWLTQVAETTAREPNAGELQQNFINPLKHFARMSVVAPEAREIAQHALQQILSSQWTPRHVVMHGDLWRGNILFSDPNNRPKHLPFARLVIIDWPGGMTDGYAIYDLIRIGISMRLPRMFLQKHIKRHCEILGCRTLDARYHLISALAHIGQNLNHFPPQSFARLTNDCLQFLQAGLPSD